MCRIEQEMHDLKSPFRLPPADSQSSLIPGDEPGTAIRVRRQCNEGVIVLEQLRHSRSAGWYVQRSFAIPADALPALISGLRKADCFRDRPERTLRVV